MEQHSDQIRARITGTGNLLREIFACLFPVLGMLYAFHMQQSHCICVPG